MRAAQYHSPGQPLAINDVAKPVIGTGEVLVRITASGVCHSDLRLIDGTEDPVADYGATLPITLGHENAGTVAEIGERVIGLAVGDAVAVYGAWGCGACPVCRSGEEQQCDVRRWVGVGRDGGYAEYLRVPAARHLIPLAGLDPVEAAPLTDAGVTPYRAIRRCLSVLAPGTSLVVIGVGGLGHMAVQIAKAVTPGTVVMAVDVTDERLQLASEVGADEVVDGRGDAAEEIMRRSDGAGARAVIDLVGSDETLGLANAVVGPGGVIVLAGGAGGGLDYRWHFGEATVTSTTWGSLSDLAAVLQLAKLGRVQCRIERFPLEAINEVLARLERGEILGRAVVIP